MNKFRALMFAGSFILTLARLAAVMWYVTAFGVLGFANASLIAPALIAATLLSAAAVSTFFASRLA